MWYIRLVALWYVGSSWARDQTHVSCIGRQILYHGGTRDAQEYFSNISFKTILFIFFFLRFFFDSYSFIDNARCHPLCVWCVFVYLQFRYKFIYKFYKKYYFLVFHFHDIDLKLFILFFFEEPQKTNSKYLKKRVIHKSLLHDLVACNFIFPNVMLFLVLPFSWMCMFTVADFIYRLLHRKFSHLLSQPRIYFNFFFLILYHLFSINIVFFFF